MKLVLIALIIFISGCVGSGSEPVVIDASNGIIINEFSVNPISVDDNDEVFFSVDIQNAGGREATEVSVNLVGVEDSWRGQNCQSDPTTQLLSSTSLKNPDINFNRAGESRVLAKTLCPPDLPEGVNANFPVTLKVNYKYTTTSTFVIPVIKESEYEKRQIIGSAIESTITSQNTDGPLKMQLTKGDSPIILPDNDRGKVSLLFELTNVGNGFPIESGKIGKIESGKVKITGVGTNTNFKCGGANNGGNLNKEIVRLRFDGSVPISCNFDAQLDSEIGNLIIIFEDIKYSYFVEETKTVSVSGR